MIDRAGKPHYNKLARRVLLCISFLCTYLLCQILVQEVKIMDVLRRLARAGVVPVVVLEEVKDAVPTATAMVAGGIDEIGRASCRERV